MPMPIQLSSLGWEKLDDPAYQWDGAHRSEREHVLFQYTLSGQGSLRLGNTEVQTTTGKAFLVTIPGEHHYGLPPAGGVWEFMYIMLHGPLAVSLAEAYQAKNGCVVELNRDAPVIRYLSNLLDKAENRLLASPFEASDAAYRFMMLLLGDHPLLPKDERLPEPIAQVLQYIEMDYKGIESLEQLAQAAGLSKYYFVRLFQKHMGNTPLEYVNKLRIERAAELLRTTALSVEEIAEAVGFASGNYFSKVFKHWLGMSPAKFRKAETFMPVNKLFIQ